MKKVVLAYAQLMRLPNVFTAFADIAMAGTISGLITRSPVAFGFALFASGAFYLGGMVWNDVFDRREDARTQPFRPIPSGRVRVKNAVILGVILFLIGVGLAYGATRFVVVEQYPVPPMLVIAGLIAAILLYNIWLKKTIVGPIAMGSCRSFNILFPLLLSGSMSEGLLLHIPLIIGVYIVGVTWFARSEETVSQRRQLMLASGVMAIAVLGGLALTIDTELVHFRPFPYLIALFTFVIGIPITKAIQQPEPKHVQAAVKRCILSLILFDAILATAVVGWPGLAILLLLPPALVIGRWVYST